MNNYYFITLEGMLNTRTIQHYNINISHVRMLDETTITEWLKYIKFINLFLEITKNNN